MNLPTGSYTITVNDLNDCEETHTVFLNNGNNDLDLLLTPTNGLCGELGLLDSACGVGTLGPPGELGTLDPPSELRLHMKDGHSA